jgi:membrane protease YdiL (CAAX protease family)
MSEEEGQIAAEREPVWIRVLEFPLVALTVATILFITASWLAYRVLEYEPAMSADMRVLAEASLNIGLLWVVYKLVIRNLGDKPHDDLPLKGAVSLTLQGLGIGAALFGAVVAIAALTGAYRIVGEGGTSGLVTGLVSFALLPGFREELLFRGILFRWLEEFGGSWLALAVTSALFGLAHLYNPNATWWSSFAIAVEAGVLLGAAYMLTRSLWVPIGLHAAWNFTQYAFDVPVSGIDSNGLVDARLQGPAWLSGGEFGLEGSVIALVLATGLGIWMLVKAKQRGLVYGPMWSRDGALTFPQRTSIA